MRAQAAVKSVKMASLAWWNVEGNAMLAGWAHYWTLK
jgi:hypothetical protein